MAYQYHLAPKEFSEQCAAFKRKYNTIEDLPTDEYIMLPKYDGCMVIIVTGPKPIILTRTHETVFSLPHVLEQACEAYPNQVLFGEAYKFDTPFKDISGKFRRHAPQPDLFVMLFDAVPLVDWQVGDICDTPYIERLAGLKERAVQRAYPDLILAPAMKLAAPQEFANIMVDKGGYDGAILRRSKGPWYPGPSKSGEAIKVKPTQSLDLKVVGWFLGNGKHEGRAGGILVEYKGIVTNVGTGFNDHEREKIALNGIDGRIAEIEFLAVTKEGRLREPRFKGWRHDKLKAD